MWTFARSNKNDIIKNLIVSIASLVFGLIVITFVINCNFKSYESENYHKHRLVIIVLDALRHDYLDIAKERNIQLPNLQKMATKGTRVMKMTPVFPSVTMPNHQTLITGLYSPYHGITHNKFNDSSFNYEMFRMANQTSLNEKRWFLGYPDPIWVTCEKVHNCKSASMLWPNTDAEFNGYFPSQRIDQYSILNHIPNIYPYDRRVDIMLRWIKNDLIDFGMLYFDEPDVTSHKFGPFHKKTLKKVAEMDGWVGRFIDGIETAGLSDKVDIILTADHGMTNLSRDRVINIDQFVPPDIYKSTYDYPVGIIYPNPGKEKEVYERYKNASTHIKVYWRTELPDIYNYKDNERRISPIVTIVDLGWVVNSSHKIFKFKEGSHGYYEEEDDMKATLLAVGPSFRNTVIKSAKHVDLYPLMAHLLGLKANPNNGSFSALSSMLTSSAMSFHPRENRWSYVKFTIFITFVVSIYLICYIVYIIFLLYNFLCGQSTHIEGTFSPE